MDGGAFPIDANYESILKAADWKPPVAVPLPGAKP